LEVLGLEHGATAPDESDLRRYTHGAAPTEQLRASLEALGFCTDDDLRTKDQQDNKKTRGLVVSRVKPRSGRAVDVM